LSVGVVTGVSSVLTVYPNTHNGDFDTGALTFRSRARNDGATTAAVFPLFTAVV